jgi:hypothetical protein
MLIKSGVMLSISGAFPLLVCFSADITSVCLGGGGGYCWIILYVLN